MTEPIQRESHEPSAADDIQFLAERADPERFAEDKGKGEALMVLLTALSNSRYDQHHQREREELLASIRR